MNSLVSDDSDFNPEGSGNASVQFESPLFDTRKEITKVTITNSSDIVLSTPLNDSRSTTSITILVVVAVIAILTLLIFAIITFRYLFVHKGSYKVKEFPSDTKPKDSRKSAKSNSVYDVEKTTEWLI